MRHETPSEIANVLARHAPRTPSSILDPCVGNGALLAPVLSRLSWNVSRVTCLDTDASVLGTVRATLSHNLNGKLETRTDNFIGWARKSAKRFDCIVMNPPFCGKRTNWTEIGPEKQQKIPVEGEFVRQAITLLNNNGVLLAILPSSVICGSTLAWLRNEMLLQGSINYLHELSEKCFPGIDGRMYLVAYKKSKQSNSIVFLNHDLHAPETLVLPTKSIGAECRFDFGYHAARQKLKEIELIHPQLNWTQASKILRVFHGTIRVGKDKETPALHTSDYRDGFWQNHPKLSSQPTSSSDSFANNTDVLLKRLGRNCSRSFGILANEDSTYCTDSVWILRLRISYSTVKLLFVLRCLSNLPWVSSLLEKGVGAKYIAGADVLDLRLPLSLPKYFFSDFRSYCCAVKKYDVESMKHIEKNVCDHLVNT